MCRSMVVFHRLVCSLRGAGGAGESEELTGGVAVANLGFGALDGSGGLAARRDSTRPRDDHRRPGRPVHRRNPGRHQGR